MKGWVLRMEHVSTSARRGCVGWLSLCLCWAIARCGDSRPLPPDAPAVDAPADVTPDACHAESFCDGIATGCPFEAVIPDGQQCVTFRCPTAAYMVCRT